MTLVTSLSNVTPNQCHTEAGGDAGPIDWLMATKGHLPSHPHKNGKAMDYCSDLIEFVLITLIFGRACVSLQGRQTV